MAETEDQTYARIAKHNGTTPDEERQIALRIRLGATDLGDQASASVSAVSHSAVGISETGRNPFLITLVVLTAVFGVVGVVLYFLGSAQNPIGDDPAASLPFLVAGNSWMSFAGVTFLATMIVGGINWQLSKVQK
jgi:hypothetical protein